MSKVMQPRLFNTFQTSRSTHAEAIRNAVESLASHSKKEARGAVFTRPEVVAFILDLVGYVEERPLHKMRILEPSFGVGNFLLPMVARLLSAWCKYGQPHETAEEALGQAIRGVELHRETFEATQQAVVRCMTKAGLTMAAAKSLAGQWLCQGDFLLNEQNGPFDFVVGNPPYLRQEQIPTPLLSEYRLRYRTLYDRADLYIPFIERSLSLLAPLGTLGFICANRWVKNRYGGPLRQMVATEFHLKAYIDMEDSDAFCSAVSAYPAITVITRSKGRFTCIARRPKIEKKELATIAKQINSEHLGRNRSVRVMTDVVRGAEPWVLESSVHLALIRRLEEIFPRLEHAGCKVGIGVATGADRVFIGPFIDLDVEADRKIPLVATKDISSGEVQWKGHGVINPFGDDGKLVDLNSFPKLERYLIKHKAAVAKRHCAQKNPANWYRTIDRIWPELTYKPKLLIPDIKGKSHVVFEPGQFYPHHNLYFVVSDTWDLRALQAVLLSCVARLFVATYATKMRGGYLRFQAQYLRRICIPDWAEVPVCLRQELADAAKRRDLVACNQAAFKLYGLTLDEQAFLLESWA